MLSLNLANLEEGAKKQIQTQCESLLALHQSLRDGTCLGGEMTGWYDYPKKGGFTVVDEIASAIQKQSERVGSFNTVVVIGIGGSYLGMRAIYDSLAHFGQKTGVFQKKVIFLGWHLCVEEIEATLSHLKKDECHPVVVAISKSGTTLEPAVSLRLVWQTLTEKYGPKDASHRVIAVTSPVSGKLGQMAEHFSWTKFGVPENIGGRYSVTSAVGLVPLTLSGAPAGDLMKGADDFFSQSFSLDSPLYQYVAARQFFGSEDGKKKVEFLVYNRPRLSAFVEWWKQLFAESEGKSGKGLLPCGFLTTTDLHSLGQYLQDGPRLMFETFLSIDDQASTSPKKVGKAAGFEDGLDSVEGRSVWGLNELVSTATIAAHADGLACPLQLKLHSDLNLYSLGYLFSFFETACALSALSLGLNPFDQPGVEAYKNKMKQSMGE